MSNFRYGSVCSGIEAATQAWHPLGWESAFFSEIEQFPRAVLEHHYPNTPVHGDFTTIGADEYGTIDLLVGGTPCQSFSIAGLRKGLDDDRGNLALEFLRLAQRTRPQWVVWENVPGILSSNEGRDFGTFLGGLGELGYGWAYRVLDAQHFGVPQRRRRVFVVGYLGDWRPPTAVLFERHSLCGHPAPKREAREDVAACLGASPAGNSSPNIGNGQGTVVPSWPADTACTLNTAYGSKMGLENQHALGGGSMFVPSIGSKNDLPVLASGQAGAPISNNLAPTLDCNNDGAPIAFQGNATADQIAAAGHNVSPTMASGSNAQPAVAFAQNTRDEVRESDLAGSLTGQGGKPGQGYQAVREGMQVRRLSPVECERLQGFPDNYTRIPYRNKPWDKCPDGPRYKALGNSMAVPVMRWIGSRIQMLDDTIDKAIEIIRDIN